MKKLILLLILLLFIAPLNLAAAELSVSELVYGEYFSINGSGFGEADEYSKVCFSYMDVCFTAGDFKKDGMLWSDTEIKLYAPDNVYTSGNIIVYVKQTKRVCREQTPGDADSATCVNSFVSQEKEIISYRIKPVVKSVIPQSPVKPGEKITIYGSGFGDTKGSIYFDSYEGYIVNWATSTIEVKPTTIIQDKTEKLKVKSDNALETEINYLVSVKNEEAVGKNEQTNQNNIGSGDKTAKPGEKVIQKPEKQIIKTEAVIRQEFINQEKARAGKVDKNLVNRLQGSIVLQVEEQGQSWYINPTDKKKYYLGRPSDAFNIMRTLALGVNHKFIADNKIFSDCVAGRILLDVEDHGKAYYINPKDNKAYYLGKPADAFNVMKNLGLGISNTNIRNIEIGE